MAAFATTRTAGLWSWDESPGGFRYELDQGNVVVAESLGDFGYEFFVTLTKH